MRTTTVEQPCVHCRHLAIQWTSRSTGRRAAGCLHTACNSATAWGVLLRFVVLESRDLPRGGPFFDVVRSPIFVFILYLCCLKHTKEVLSCAACAGTRVATWRFQMTCGEQRCESQGRFSRISVICTDGRLGWLGLDTHDGHRRTRLYPDSRTIAALAAATSVLSAAAVCSARAATTFPSAMLPSHR